MDDKKVRIRIEDLPKNMKVSKDEMRKILGGGEAPPPPERPSGPSGRRVPRPGRPTSPK